jgi:thiol-disulfide isomerase/thioredoxin
MKKLTLAFLAAAMAAGLATAQAPAQGLVGKPAPAISATDWLNSLPLSLQAAKGKIVMVEFWATWCPPCRASIPHLIEMFKTYSPKGVVFMSLTDEPKATVEPFAKQMNMIYPVGCGSQTGSAYGVRGIPYAFIIDPSGNVAWEGHPMAGLDKALEAQLAKTPPAMGDENAGVILAKAEEAVRQKRFLKTARLLVGVSAGNNADLNARLDALRRTLTERAAARLAEGKKGAAAAAQHVSEKAMNQAGADYYAAHDALREAATLVPSTGTAAQAQDILSRMLSDAFAKASIRACRMAEGGARLAMIERDAEKVPTAETLEALEDLAAELPDTIGGREAAEKARALRADPNVMKKIQNDAAEKDCKGWMSMARNFIKTGLPDKARPFLDQVIQKYPDTDYAKEAKELLQKMNRKD